MENDTLGRINLYRDPDARQITTLGLDDRDEEVMHTIARPSAFVVDDAGIVRYRYVGSREDDRPKAALLLLAAESLELDANAVHPR